MRHAYSHAIDYSTALLSAFDIAGSLAISKFEWSARSPSHDMNQLNSDLTILEQDYLKAIEKLSKNEDISNETIPLFIKRAF